VTYRGRGSGCDAVVCPGGKDTTVNYSRGRIPDPRLPDSSSRGGVFLGGGGGGGGLEGPSELDPVLPVR